LGFYETSKQHKETGDEGHTNKTTIKEMAKEERGMQKEETQKRNKQGNRKKREKQHGDLKSILFGEQSRN
jgi:hypothetical protein